MCVLHFDEEDVPDQYEVIDDPATVLLHCQWCDIAWHYATPHREYAPNPVSVTPHPGPLSPAFGGSGWGERGHPFPMAVSPLWLPPATNSRM